MIEIETLIEADAWGAIDLPSLAEAAIHATLAHHRIAVAEIAVLGCDDAAIARLNDRFRGRGKPTNVLSWPSAERGAAAPGAAPDPPGEEELGDIAIAWETCVAEAEKAGIPVGQHVSHLLVHAALHLLGYDHGRAADAHLMERIEIEILAAMGLPDPYGTSGAEKPDNGKVR